MSNQRQLLILEALVPDVLKSSHSNVSCGYLGMAKTLARVGECVYRSAYKTDVEDWIQLCGPYVLEPDPKGAGSWERILELEPKQTRS